MAGVSWECGRTHTGLQGSWAWRGQDEEVAGQRGEWAAQEARAQAEEPELGAPYQVTGRGQGGVDKDEGGAQEEGEQGGGRSSCGADGE